MFGNSYIILLIEQYIILYPVKTVGVIKRVVEQIVAGFPYSRMWDITGLGPYNIMNLHSM